MLASLRKLQKHHKLEVEARGDRIQNDGKKGGVNVAENMMIQRQQHAAVEMVVAKAEQLLAIVLTTSGRVAVTVSSTWV